MKNKILIIKLGALGDMVQSTSAFSALREFHFKDHITLLTTPPYQEFASKMGYFDEILLDNRLKLSQFRKLLNFGFSLRKERFYKVYDLQDVDRTKLYSYFLAKQRNWISFDKEDYLVHPQDRFRNLFLSLGIPFKPSVDLSHLADSNNLTLPFPYVLLVPGASLAHNGKKKWPEKNYAELALFLLERNIQPVLLGGPCDHFDLINRKVSNVIDLSGKTTFYQVIGLAQKALCTVGNDTGATLLAASAGCKTLTLYSKCNPPSLGGARGTEHIGLYQPHLKDLGVDIVSKALETFLTL